MITSKSNLKAARVSLRRQQRNKAIRSSVRTHLAKVDRLISSNDLETAKNAAASASIVLDKAARKGVIHPNNAARRKSRLTKKLKRVSEA